MNFIEAVEKAKENKKVAREGWNGRGMFIIFQPGSDIKKS